jgi:hypothetical protein
MVALSKVLLLLHIQFHYFCLISVYSPGVRRGESLEVNGFSSMLQDYYYEPF